MAAAAIIAVGVALYWQQVGAILENDVKTHVAAASEEAATDFNRLISTDRQVLESIAITVEDTYPWSDPRELTEFLQRQTRHNSFKLLGVITGDDKVFLSEPRRFSPAFITDVMARTLEAEHYLSVSQADPSDGEDVLVQSVALRKNGKPVGALFALQQPERYRPLLALSAMGNKGYSIVTKRDGEPVLGYKKPDFSNVFILLKDAEFDDKNTTLEGLRSSVQRGEHSMVGYRLNDEHRFLHFIPLALNDWYLLSTLPTIYVEHQAQHLTWLSLILFSAIFLVFCGLLFYTLYMRAYSNRQLFATAFVDQLTGADNFNRMCEQFPEKLAALNGKAALLIFDINKFKVINDLHGYERGNQVLQRVARVLRENVGPDETFCRSTADNFVLLLKYDDRKSFRARLSNLSTQLRRDCTVEGSCLMIDVAFGVYEVTEDIPFYIMLDRAHLALENAKKMSFEKCQFYEAADLRRIVAEKQIENTMERALEDGSFAVYLQPKCDVATGQMKGAEALVRWNRLEGIVRPDDFIPIFEKNGFILRLDMFILEEVSKMLAQWKNQGLAQVPVAVNFSRLHLNDAGYIPQMVQVVNKYNIPHELIEVELTESVVFNNLERAQSVMRGLHERGFSVAMDDFGSGYSSLNVLKNLQFDSIKLDKEFLSSFEDNPQAKKVISGAVAMIKSLGIQVVAEGVETRKQADFLREAGCDLAQGYLFSRPLPVVEFEKLLRPQTQAD